MRVSLLVSALVAPLALAAPTLDARQAAPVKPAPCVRDSKVTVQETEARFKRFAQAFIYQRDISKAFSFIAVDYINHNPQVANGSTAAWEVLSPFWNTANITAKRDAFISPMSWVNYDSDFGDVVDRFRWEGGCIVEHWDQNETFPAIKGCKAVY
ncbi:hypothetical protein COCC4DRAFT_43517 [Bipolaris maydis ATCC 48331]|uniref:SnoaL-like domain-containing protein n=2 Tax=Cochliobolus heterostrophus TaxID=5016 RepID=M2V3P9_COCH5|nr:uncharacterized protein COCC4DRAFT_43517 [Bipolaris maydis ATCC 48331]EMD94632.1 hypothetical protein COCHEDRAFT_1210671 [Bipolaris maydis C5]KAH7556147.1 hypothetical protein BM1_06673 [Bipolaris maydis]ENI01657.1 hypothetical protein COCC4DRAFT_43517 [Bipolaris maydis ATCC 48331]KAJ5029066.1 hypothetical protein J3E73DRAFT_406090 [Bipolaris maydis]KAJ6276315.1 hypothetical protein PSV08DRAFT_376984 [Bipolaris maydis]